MTNNNSAPSAAVLLAFATIYFVWGSTYLGIRWAIETIPPFSMAAVRFLSAGALMFAWASWRGKPWPALVHWRSAFIIGGLMLFVGNGLLTWAEQFVPSGIAALIVATVPLWMVGMEAFTKEGKRPGPSIIVGLILGMIGIAILIGPGVLADEPVDLIGASAIVFASFAWALGSVYSRHAPQVPSTIQNVGMQMLLGGVLLYILGYSSGERIDVGEVSAKSAWSLAYLSLIGGILAYSAYVWLIKVSTPTKVSTYAYVNPVVAVLLGWLLAGEPMGPRVLLAGAAVVSAVVLIVTTRRGK